MHGYVAMAFCVPPVPSQVDKTLTLAIMSDFYVGLLKEAEKTGSYSPPTFRF